MRGPYYVGNKRKLTAKPSVGTPATVRISLKDPSGNITEHPCTFNAVTQEWETTDEVYFDEGGWWRAVDVWWSSTDTTTSTESAEEPFLVHDTGFPASAFEL